ncbi:MAG TPA: hypothetical protein VGQ59_17120 [Cyclobacteriaceae bacterium]|jgi:hypothetical protein|nr:hypothetical protein [Cyclobacteriaceae bacterium]
MNKFISYVIILLTSFLLNACSALWIPDPVDPRLPKFTETGNNVAGALVNEKIWEARTACFLVGGCNNAMKFLLNADSSLTVSLEGSVDGIDMTFNFTIKSQSFLTYSDLRLLNGKKFTIDGKVNTVVVDDLSRSNTPIPCTPGVYAQGQLYFVGVKQYVYSGTFGFKIDDPSGCGNYEVSYGRFDFGLNQ